MGELGKVKKQECSSILDQMQRLQTQTCWEWVAVVQSQNDQELKKHKNGHVASVD